jgi:hypothetical protein
MSGIVQTNVNGNDRLMPDLLERSRRQRESLTARLEATQVKLREASYQGTCAGHCGVPVEPGDEIACLYDRWMHLTCAVCPSCERWVIEDGNAVVAGDGLGLAHDVCPWKVTE